MKRSIVGVVACAVWLSAAASAAALTYELNCPLVPSAASATMIRPPSPFTAATSGLLESAAPNVLEIPAITIVGRFSKRAVPARAAAPELPRAMATMNCTGWRDLDMGSGRVQVCE
jgi:hypothetical protein